MKKIFALLLAAVMCFSLVACGGGEKGNADKITEESPATSITEESPFTNIAVGDEVIFGNYNGDIKWIVLDVQEDHAVLLCKTATAPKSNYSVDGKWHTSEMLPHMSMLAGRMFTDEQKNQTMHPILDGEESKGYMFLLNSEEVEAYMPGEDNEWRLAMASETAIKDGVKVYENAMGTGAYCNWILRDGAWVGGQRGNAGKIVNTTEQKYGYGIRPAIWVSIP